jgi:hypothetical protein
MLLDYIRVLKYSGSFTDYSLENFDETQTIPTALTTTEYIYIAQKMPFNMIFVHLDTANTNAASLDIEYWDGTTWRNAIDILDGTKTAGVTLAKSGAIQFSIDDQYNWQEIPRTSDTNSPTPLQTLKIYNCYWLRITVSANLSAGTDIKELGYAFTTSTELNNYDVEVNGFFSAFETGKTDWIEEIMIASKLLVLDLRRLGLIVHAGQIIQLDDVYVPCTYKTLQLIYENLGPNYNEKRARVQKQYEMALNLKRFTFDSDGDGRIVDGEQTNTIQRLTR